MDIKSKEKKQLIKLLIKWFEYSNKNSHAYTNNDIGLFIKQKLKEEDHWKQKSRGGDIENGLKKAREILRKKCLEKIKMENLLESVTNKNFNLNPQPNTTTKIKTEEDYKREMKEMDDIF